MGPRETCVYTAQGETEAQRVRGFLEAHGIPCEFRGEALRITHGLTLDGAGRVEVHVPLHRLREARELVARPTCVYTAQGEAEAQQIRAFLEQHGIPCEFRGEALRITHGLTLDGLGAVEVHVPLHSAREAREFIARAEAGELRIDDEPESEAP